MFNNITIIGNLSTDPTMKTSPSGTIVTTFTLANDNGKDRKTNLAKDLFFIECVAFGKPAEGIAKNFRKGNLIGLSGRLMPNIKFSDEGVKRDGNLRIIVNAYDFMHRDTGEKRYSSYSKPIDTPSPEEAEAADELDPVSIDDLPF